MAKLSSTGSTTVNRGVDENHKNAIVKAPGFLGR